MGIIHVLDKHTANLIAAGEVVERPASAIKEMLENAADAGATRITVEIKNGGTTYFRVTDNGCGISAEDLPKTILRHATSKIREPSDLSAIGTYGFRGEALAAIAAVSELRILTKRREDANGSVLHVRGGEILEIAEAGCPDGTTVTVSDIFKNLPARRKFLKKDSSEASACLAVTEKFALSRPHIAVNFLSDGNEKLSTDGSGSLKNAIYFCLGKDFAARLVPVNYTHEGITIDGFVGKPETARPSRGLQNFFINGRYVRSGTMCAALEEGFRAFCPIGKFPAAVLFCTLDPHRVDVNVHPAKTEVKFSEEKLVFEAVLFAVRSALNRGTTYDAFSDAPQKAANASSDRPAQTSSTDRSGQESKASFLAHEQSSTVGQEKACSDLAAALGMKQAPRSSTAQLADLDASRQSDTSGDTSSFRRESVPTAPLSGQSTLPPNEKTASTSSHERESYSPAPHGTAKAALDSEKNGTPLSNRSCDESASVPDFRNAFSNDVDGLSGGIRMQAQSLEVHAPDTFTAPAIDTTVMSIPTPPPVYEAQAPTTEPPIQQSFLEELAEEDNAHVAPIRYRVIGECFDTFILVEKDGVLYIIDKHAAHERILYEEIKHAADHNGAQYMLEPIPIRLSTEEYAAMLENKSYFDGTGFIFDSFGDNTILLRAFPEHISSRDLPDVITCLAAKLSEGNGNAAGDLFDRALFTAACKAAVKAGQRNSSLQDEYIAEKIFSDEAILYCPHGRPVLTEFTKDKLYRIFKRT